MYSFYLGGIRFPITPEQVQFKIKNKNTSITLMNEGEVNILKDAGLTEITFEAILPNTQYSRVIARYPDGFQKAQYYMDYLEKFKTDKSKVLFKIIRRMPDRTYLTKTRMYVSLEEYTKIESVSDGTDVRVKVTLKQWKRYGTRKAKIVKDNTDETDVKVDVNPTREDGAKSNTKGTKYTIMSGDTLWAIAKKKLGDGSKYTEIYNANKTVIEKAAKAHGKASSSNGHWIYPNTVIVIP